MREREAVKSESLSLRHAPNSSHSLPLACSDEDGDDLWFLSTLQAQDRGMQWHCPACQTIIQHSGGDVQRDARGRYRCHICRLELRYDAAADAFVVATFDAERVSPVNPDARRVRPSRPRAATVKAPHK